MDNDGGMSINNSGQPDSAPVNGLETQAEKVRTTNWRPLVVLSTLGLIVILLATGVYLRLVHRQPAPQTGTIQVPSPSPVLSRPVTPTPLVELPPLYPRIQWEATESGKFVFPTRNSGSVELEGYYIESVKVRTFPKDFLAYYERELSKIGWEEIDFAGGGTSGEWHGYEKNGHYFSFGVRRGGISEDEYQAVVQHN